MHNKTHEIMNTIKGTVNSLSKKQLAGIQKSINNKLEDGYFKITSVHRDDLTEKGFDVSKVDDGTMESLAGKLANDYCEQLFWLSLEIIAEEYFEIPKLKA